MNDPQDLRNLINELVGGYEVLYVVNSTFRVGVNNLAELALVTVEGLARNSMEESDG